MVEPPQKSYFPVAAHSIQCAFYFSHGSFSSDFRISQTVLFNSDILRIFTISGITIMTQTIGSATITPVYPRSGTNVTAITTFRSSPAHWKSTGSPFSKSLHSISEYTDHSRYKIKKRIEFKIIGGV